LGKIQAVLKGNQLTVASLWSQFGRSSLFIKVLKCFLSFKHELKCFDEQGWTFTHAAILSRIKMTCFLLWEREQVRQRDPTSCSVWKPYPKGRLE